MRVICLHVCKSTMCVQSPWKPEKGIGSPGTQVIDGWEMYCGCSKSSPGPLQERPRLASTEPSPQPL